jgi:predicted amidophosphoribosyltransferase
MARRIPFERLGCVDVCAPVPSHPARLLDRGLDIALALAKGLTQGQKWSIASDLLVRRHLGIPQNELGREERLHNVMHVFGPGTGVAAAGVAGDAGTVDKPLNVLLVDDVVTTGATLDACASILEARGHRVVLAALAFRREIFQRTG